MKFSPVTSLLIGLVLFLPSLRSTAQQNGEPHPQLEPFSPTKRSDAQAAVTQLAQNGTTTWILLKPENRRMRLQKNLAPVRRQNRMGRSSPYARR